MNFLTRIFHKNQQPQQAASNWAQRLFRDLRDVFYVLAVFMLVYVLFFRVIVVEGSSMNQTLIDGDRLLLVSNLLYSNPKQGDVIVASKESFRGGECIIKRVIATEGQVVDINFSSRTVYVDGTPLKESYVYFAPNDSRPLLQEGMRFPLTVEEGCVFAMGDNRNDSKDSRHPDIGLIDRREILGRAVLVMLPGIREGADSADFGRIGVIN